MPFHPMKSQRVISPAFLSLTAFHFYFAKYDGVILAPYAQSLLTFEFQTPAVNVLRLTYLLRLGCIYG